MGKTTFSRRAAERLGCPLFSLDEWAPPGSAVSAGSDFRERVEREHLAERWVSDGNFAAVTFDLRLPRATEIVWLEVPRAMALVRVVRRALGPDPTHGLGGLPEVLRYLIRFDRVNRPKIEAEIGRHGPQIPQRILRSGREIEAYLEGLRPD
ncbi:MAG: hypothetical protein MH204_03035 [Fimbriimonadaceae bacterium]|nr:hypothetical protein [Fimbriimonadaceae bacterium]